VRGPETRFHLILLAAGLSTRFGSNKLLYEINGKLMYRHMADRLLSLAAKDPAHMDLLVVTSYEEIQREMEAAGAQVTVNPDPARGISSSIHCALHALEEGSGIYGNDFLLFFNGDQIGLRLETIRRFTRELKESGRRLGAVWDGTDMRSPCAFGAEYLPALFRISGDRGGKGILRKKAEQVFLFSVENEEELEDIDSL
jgi:molybdenum cofactor cytidylyltransferase